ncbi:questin oxidase family protein [Rubrivivax sp. RP6-9]|uniref:questin oxidase family protein n=1 Tax=Rubrivivax sp. RP6-9 TaxID=3415750 RepID=UPI003CC54559
MHVPDDDTTGHAGSVLYALLDGATRFDAEYRGGLSNHLPMALAALQRLGADDARLQAFARTYATRLQPAAAPVPWPSGEPWPDRLGQPDAWPAYRGLFREWLEHDGSDVLTQALPQLMQGCGAAAFHGLIRTAYALQARHADELADALAYWACRHLPLDGTPPATDHGLIFEAMQRAAAAPGFAAAVDAVALDAGTLQRLAHDAALLYAASGDFTVLHLVTSAHALRTLLPHLAEHGDEALLLAVDDYVIAYTAALHASGARRGTPAEPLPWDTLVATALQSDDDHLIKLVDSCREETQAYGGDAWQRAASRAVADHTPREHLA